MNRERRRTIVIAGGVYVVELIVNVVCDAWSGGDRLKYFTFMAAFQPQTLVLEPEKTG